MQRSDLSASVKLFLKFDISEQCEAGFRRGVIQICKRVKRLGSLNRAAKDMGMAYSKAWRIVKNAEEMLSVKLFIRQGASGSILTEEAEALISIFDYVEEGLAVQAEKLLSEAFDKYVKDGMFEPEITNRIETTATPELIEEVRSIELHAVIKH